MAVRHKTGGDANVGAATREDLERRSGRDTDPLAGQSDDGSSLVMDGHP